MLYNESVNFRDFMQKFLIYCQNLGMAAGMPLPYPFSPRIYNDKE